MQDTKLPMQNPPARAACLSSLRRSAATVFAALTLALSAAAATSCQDDGPCVEGEACICEEDCSEACEGAGCGFTCEGVNCDFSCPEGGCAATCAEGSDCNMDCSGGNCNMTCVAGAKCAITECDAGCIMSCGGSDDCNNSCSEAQGCIKG